MAERDVAHEPTTRPMVLKSMFLWSKQHRNVAELRNSCHRAVAIVGAAYCVYRLELCAVLGP